MAPSLKFTQVTASLVNFSTADVLFGVQNATSDRTWTLPQLQSAMLATANIVTATISTSTISTSTFNNGTIGTSTINNSTLNTSILNVATINTATIADATINTATINTATINNSTLNTTTINTAILNSPTIGNATINAPTINTPAINTATINTATINNVVLNTATINTGTFNNVTINTATLSTSTFNNGTIGTATINNSTLGTATINNSTISTATINTATLSNSSLNLLATVAATQLGSAVFSGIPSGYNKVVITFENVCPVSTALLTTSLNMQVATSGTAFVSASYVSGLTGFAQGTTFIIGTTSAFYLSGITATTCVGTSTIYGVNGFIEITNPGNAVFRKSLRGELNYLTPGAVSTLTNALALPSGFWDGAANAINAIAIAFQTGNISTGTFRMYGRK